jgi:hypothetical protein
VKITVDISNEVRAQQYSHEVDTWLRTLDYLQQENIHLKNRVVDLLQYDISSEFLDRVEYFHNKFLDKDPVLSLLRHDVTDLSMKMAKKNNASPDKQLLKKEETLRKDMEKMEVEFNKLKSDFNKYIFEVLQETSLS